MDDTHQGLAAVEAAADYLSVSRSTIYSLMQNGTLPSIRLPNLRARRIPWTALRELVGQAMQPEDDDARLAKKLAHRN